MCARANFINLIIVSSSGLRAPTWTTSSRRRPGYPRSHTGPNRYIRDDASQTGTNTISLARMRMYLVGEYRIHPVSSAILRFEEGLARVEDRKGRHSSDGSAPSLSMTLKNLKLKT